MSRASQPSARSVCLWPHSSHVMHLMVHDSASERKSPNRTCPLPGVCWQREFGAGNGEGPPERAFPPILARAGSALAVCVADAPGPEAMRLRRLVDAVERDYLLRDLEGEVRLHLRVEPGVVLLLRLP